MNLKKLRYQILRNFPFYSDLFLKLETKINNKLPTYAATTILNGKLALIINEEMMDTMDINQQIFVILHELKHIMLLHNYILEKRKYNNIIYNIATDIIVNELTLKEISDIGKLRSHIVTADKIEKLRDIDVLAYSSSEIYKMLMEEYKNIQLPKIDFEFDFSNENSNSDNELNKQIEKMKDFLEKIDEELENKGISDIEKEIFKHAIVDEIFRKAIERIDKEMQKKLMKEIRNSIVNGKVREKLYSKHGTQVSEYIYNHTFKKVRNYGRLLKDEIEKEIKNTFTYRKINHIVYLFTKSNRIGNLPSLDKTYSIPRVFILVDTSGSISDESYEKFLNEIYSLLKTTNINRVDIAMFDTELIPIQSKTKNAILKEILKRKGFGGTDLNNALQKIKKPNNTVLIVYTDGYFEKPDINLLKKFRKVIFVLTKDGDIKLMKELESRKIRFIVME